MVVGVAVPVVRMVAVVKERRPDHSLEKAAAGQVRSLGGGSRTVTGAHLPANLPPLAVVQRVVIRNGSEVGDLGPQYVSW